MEEWSGEWAWAAWTGWAGWLLALALCGGKKDKAGKGSKRKDKDDGGSKDASKEDAPADYIDMGVADRLPKDLK